MKNVNAGSNPMAQVAGLKYERANKETPKNERIRASNPRSARSCANDMVVNRTELVRSPRGDRGFARAVEWDATCWNRVGSAARTWGAEERGRSKL
jgi:hypothetical protein